MYQNRINSDEQVIHEVIVFGSKMFGDVAMRWDTLNKESYGCFFRVEHFAYYLRGKHF